MLTEIEDKQSKNFVEYIRLQDSSSLQMQSFFIGQVENNSGYFLQVLTPRVKAFYCAVDALRDYATAVYDATIVYEEKSIPPIRKL